MSTILERYSKTFQKHEELFRQAAQIFPDGVTHDNRHADPFPIYVDRAEGSKKWGIDGTEFIDYWSGHGALLLGHGHPAVVDAVQRQMERGTHYGASHPLEIEWASLVQELIPSAERVRFVSSGTEATLMGLRLSRTFTGKNKLLKFAGNFHGWHDFVIQDAQPPFGKAVPGIPAEVLDTTVICPPNDIAAVERYLKTDPDIACIILEPTGGSWGTIPTKGEFLRQLREVTHHYGVLLIFDEVITGFRVSPGGAQAYFGVTPDLTSLAKILAGGLPGGALAGRKEILDLISIKEQEASEERKKMPHPGTFNANPLTASAAIATLNIVKTGEPHPLINRTAADLRKGFNDVIDAHGLDWATYGEFSMIRMLFAHGEKVRANDFDPHEWDYRRLKTVTRPDLITNLRCGMLLNGIDFPGSGMTTSAHTDDDSRQTVAAFDQTINWMKEDGLI